MDGNVRTHDLLHLYLEASNMTHVIHDVYPIETDEKFNSIMDDLLEVQTENNKLLLNVLTKLKINWEDYKKEHKLE